MRLTTILHRVLILAGAALTSACSGSGTGPTPPPPVADPPKISCPAPLSVTSQTGQPLPVTYGAATVALGAPPVTINCSPASGEVFPVGAKTVTCTATDALQRTDTCTFTVTVLQPPQILLSKFVAFGDSITWGEDGQNSVAFSLGDRLRPLVQVPAASTYPSVLQRLLATRYTAQTMVVFNAGCAGEAVEGAPSPCTSNGGGAIARFGSVVAGGAYQAALLMEGANDLRTFGTAGADAAIAGLRVMIQSARTSGLRVFLATLTPQNPAPACVPVCRGQAAALVPPYNDRIKALAFSENAIPVDVYQAFNGDVTTLIGPDGLHPTVAGYAVIANTFYTVLRQALETSPPPTPTTLLTAPVAARGRTSSSATTTAAGPGSRPATRKPR